MSWNIYPAGMGDPVQFDFKPQTFNHQVVLSRSVGGNKLAACGQPLGLSTTSRQVSLRAAAWVGAATRAGTGTPVRTSSTMYKQLLCAAFPPDFSKKTTTKGSFLVLTNFHKGIRMADFICFHSVCQYSSSHYHMGK